MTADFAHHPVLERLLAWVLSGGTWLATCVIAVGLALPLFSWLGASPATTMTGVRIVTVGIALFILLPILRVLLMLIVFVCEGDYRLAAIAALVLVIIILGTALGMHMANGLSRGICEHSVS
jgi:hypothetical protein